MKHFSGRVAFVTGGASGIGYGLVQNFLKLGMKVVAVDFNQAYLQEKQQALAGRTDVHFLHADVGDRDQLRAAADEAIRRFGKIHVSVTTRASVAAAIHSTRISKRGIAPCASTSAGL